jgi:TonB family protein
MRGAHSLLMSLLLIAAQVAVPPAPPVPPPRTVPTVIDFRAGPVRCDGQEVAAVSPIRPIPVLATVAPGQVIAPYVVQFRIAADGRPLSIRPAPRELAFPYVTTDDLQPAVAAVRFAPGAARGSCAVTFDAIATPVEQAPIELLYRYTALPHERAPGEEVVDRRIREEAPGCFTGKPPAVLLRGYPDFDRIPQPQGAVSMTMVGFDIDRRGRPVAIRTLTSDGNVALDTAGRAAVAQSRFAAGAARTGCTYPYYRRQAQPMVSPQLPDTATFRPEGSTCDTLAGGWTLPPRLIFPEPFRRRAIEGVAVVRYDVAPWGQTGNAVILASEPAASFGVEALRIVQQSKRVPSVNGASGCVERVVFKLPESMVAPSDN